MAKKLKKIIAGCETCLYGKGTPRLDEEDKETIRIYCTARHTNVDINMMTKYCDFFTVKSAEKNND